LENRRHFLKKIALGTAAISTLSAFERERKHWTKLTILHTNDTHSRIEPFPDNHKKHPGLGGMARRSSLVKHIRNSSEHVLLLDSGDIFQGTPYFNAYKGALEFELMSDMRYDAATMGNHDFDNGLEGFVDMLPKANFPFICSNYDFKDTILRGKTYPYKIIHRGPIKIGIIGIGIQLEGLVDNKNFGATQYLDPIKTVDKYAKFLKAEGCQYVICLSHLGYSYDSNKISDLVLAQETENVDLILGGHTHTFLEKAETRKNLAGKPVIINQVGWAGICLGKIDIYFRKGEHMETLKGSAIQVEKNCAKI